jgi:uridine phosphorylase
VFGLKTGAVLAVVANRATNHFSPDAGVEDAIDTAVDAVSLFKKYAV